MKEMSTMKTLLIGVIIVCLSAISIALITDDDSRECVRPDGGAFDRDSRPPPPKFKGRDHGRDYRHQRDRRTTYGSDDEGNIPRPRRRKRINRDMSFDMQNDHRPPPPRDEDDQFFSGPPGDMPHDNFGQGPPQRPPPDDEDY